jgi:hypothetical protein
MLPTDPTTLNTLKCDIVVSIAKDDAWRQRLCPLCVGYPTTAPDATKTCDAVQVSAGGHRRLDGGYALRPLRIYNGHKFTIYADATTETHEQSEDGAVTGPNDEGRDAYFL